MKKLLFSICLVTVLGSYLGYSQVSRSNGNVVPTGLVTAQPNISQFEVSGRLITQNSFLGVGVIPLAQQTGSFGATARWNSMGNLPSGTQTLNGFRTQTDGRGLALGHLIPNGGTVSNSFIEIIGSNTAAPAVNPTVDDAQNLGSSSGNLDFRYAESPSGAGAARRTAFTIQPVVNVAGSPQFDAFTYARKNCLIGQLQAGKYGGLNSGDQWVGIGNANTSASSYIGTRVQSNLSSILTGVEGTLPFIQFSSSGTGSNGLPNGLKFRGENGSNITEIMKMDAQGRVDIGIDQSLPTFTIAPFNYNVFVMGKNSAQTGTVLNDQIGVGLYVRPSGIVNSQTNFRQYAVYAEANSGGQNGAVNAVYGNVVNEGPSDYSGFFNGKVISVGVVVSSDKRLKKDIKTEQSALEKIMQLKPVSYKYDRSVSKWMNLEYERTSHGFIADEVKEVFPEIVNEFAEPVMGNAKEMAAARMFKAVNYTQLISVLTKAVQEQQAKIVALEEQIKSSTTLVLNYQKTLPVEITNKSFSLSQNIPNPFTESTTISYTIPQNVSKALLAIFDLNGKMLLQYNLQQGNNQVKINGSQLTAGMYIYSLIADGAEVVSKRMILTK